MISPPPPVPPVPLGMATQTLPQHHQGYPAQPPPGVYIQPQSVQHVYGGVPTTQPLPPYETPSAFPGPSPPVSSPGIHPTASGISASGGSSYAHVGLGSSSAHGYPYNAPSMAQHLSQRMDSGYTSLSIGSSTTFSGERARRRAVPWLSCAQTTDPRRQLCHLRLVDWKENVEEEWRAEKRGCRCTEGSLACNGRK